MISICIKIKNDKATFDRKIITLILQVCGGGGLQGFAEVCMPIYGRGRQQACAGLHHTDPERLQTSKHWNLRYSCSRFWTCTPSSWSHNFWKRLLPSSARILELVLWHPFWMIFPICILTSGCVGKLYLAVQTGHLTGRSARFDVFN